MSADSSPSGCFAAQIMAESMQAHSWLMTESKMNGQSSNNIVRHSAAQKFAELDAVEASANERVLNSPSPRREVAPAAAA